MDSKNAITLTQPVENLPSTTANNLRDVAEDVSNRMGQAIILFINHYSHYLLRANFYFDFQENL